MNKENINSGGGGVIPKGYTEIAPHSYMKFAPSVQKETINLAIVVISILAALFFAFCVLKIYKLQ